MSTAASLPVRVYETQLVPLGYGLPLWCPEPDAAQGPVEIGDVGFMYQGSFRKLFNATKPIGDQNNVPPKFTPLDFSRQMHIISRKRHLLHVVSSSGIKTVSLDVHGSVITSPVSAQSRVSFKCTGNRGALLAVDESGADQEILAPNDLFPGYMLKHHHSWYEYFKQQGLRVEPEEIVMVGGTIKARKWLVAAFTGEANELSLQFDATAGIFGGLGGSLAVSTTNVTSPMYRFGPWDAATSDDMTESLNPLPKDQCVFLSRYKLLRRRFRTPKVIEAEGEHRDDHSPTDDREDGINDEVIDYSGSHCYVEDDLDHTKILDPLDTLLEYILEKSTCDTALASDEDIRILSQERDCNVSPEGFEEFLRSRQPDVILSAVSGSSVGSLVLSRESRNDILDLPHSNMPQNRESQETQISGDNENPSNSNSLPTMQNVQLVAEGRLRSIVQNFPSSGLRNLDLGLPQQDNQEPALVSQGKPPFLALSDSSDCLQHGDPQRAATFSKSRSPPSERRCAEEIQQVRNMRCGTSLEVFGTFPGMVGGQSGIAAASLSAQSEVWSSFYGIETSPSRGYLHGFAPFNDSGRMTSTGSPLNASLAQGQQAQQPYETQDYLVALELAVRNLRLAVDMTEDDGPDKANILAYLARSLYTRYQAIGELQDLEESASLFQLADALTPDDSPDKHIQLRDITISLFSRFELEGRPQDLDEAIDLGTRGIELVPDHHSDKPSLLSNLGASLLTPFRHSRVTDDLDKAILLQTRAVDLTPDRDSNKPMQLMKFGIPLRTRFRQFRNLEDIERAIELRGRALELTPDDHPNKATYLDTAGGSLQAQFDQLGAMDDLSRAIDFRPHSVDMSPDSHSSKPGRLGKLAGSLLARYEKTRDVRDLEQAIVHQTRAVMLSPNSHPAKASMLNNLGIKLQTRFERCGSLEDLDAAIAHYTNAVTLTPDGHLNKPAWLYNLGNSLRLRFSRVGNATDFEEIIRCSTRSVELLPENYPQRAQNLLLLGHSFRTRLRSSHADPDDAAHSMEAFLEAMQHPSSHTLERLEALIQCTDLLAEFSYLAPLLPSLEAYKQALDLIPQYIWLYKNVLGRCTSEELDPIAEVVGNAVAAAITAGEYVQAFEWLETSRAVVWSQVLRLRTPVDDLQQLHPQLTDNLVRISQAISAIPVSLTSTETQPTTPSFHAGTQMSHNYALEYDELIARIRKLEGFEDFMQAKTLTQLTSACATGPVVILNAHETRCDALILHHPGVVTHVPLSSFSNKQAMRLQKYLRSVLRTRNPRCRFCAGFHVGKDDESRNIRALGKNNDPMFKILEDLWHLVVKPILDAIRTSLIVPDGSLPHITWCPIGPFTFLPLHAAGIYPKGDGDQSLLQTVMDVAISSYTPNLEALLRPRTKIAAAGTHPETLIVSQPDTPGRSSASETTTEAGIVMSHLAPSATRFLSGADGTVDAVLESMAAHNWVHFACHGLQNLEKPADSCFALHDGKLTLETLVSRHLPNADLAVLSACQATTSDEELPKEAFYLAAGMLQAGYKSVVSTMWSVSDDTKEVFMDEFYRGMSEQVKAGGELQPAYAFHEATQVLRAKYGATDFMRWVPFVHFGL